MNAVKITVTWKEKGIPESSTQDKYVTTPEKADIYVEHLKRTYPAFSDVCWHLTPTINGGI